MGTEQGHPPGPAHRSEATGARIDPDPDPVTNPADQVWQATDEVEGPSRPLLSSHVPQLLIARADRRRHATVERALRLHRHATHRDAWSRRYGNHVARSTGGHT